MKKLSENLRELANHADTMKNKVAAAEQETREKVESTLKTLKAEAQARQDEFKARAKEKQAAVGSRLEKLQASYKQQVEQIKSDIESKKEAREYDRALRRAENAEAYAEDLIYFAAMAFDDAVVATLEAIDAREYAESLPSEKAAVGASK